MSRVDVLIVGAGPAGLCAAVELRRLGIDRVLVVDREAESGGIPRHCHHTGFGWFDLRRVLSGPSYARRRVRLAADSGAEIVTETTVTGWSGHAPDFSVKMTSPRGLSTVKAGSILLATGCRERSRSARLIPGTRPQGIFTTGSLQSCVYFNGERAGSLAVVVGAEHVSFSAVHTLRSTGTKVAAVVTDRARHQSYGAFRWLAAPGVPLITNAQVTEILGRGRVEAVEITDSAGNRRRVVCDTLVFTGDWIPDHELARAAGLAIDPLTKGPVVDTGLRTSAPGVFAAGNGIRGAEMADHAALEGSWAAQAIGRHLKGIDSVGPAVAIRCEGLGWITPQKAVPGESIPIGRFSLRVPDFVDAGNLIVSQGESVLFRQRLRHAVPNQSLFLSSEWLNSVVPAAGPVTVRLEAGR